MSDEKNKPDLSMPGTFSNLPKEERDRLLTEGINVHLSSGQVMKFKIQTNPFLEARRRKFQKG